MELKIENSVNEFFGIKVYHIKEIKTFKRPSPIVEKVIEAVLTLLGKKCYCWEAYEIELSINRLM